MMLPLVALALHAGGNEHKMDPGFALIKKLAQSGNIGRVGVTDTDFSTSLTSGETARRLLLGAAADDGREIVPRGAADQAGGRADLPLSSGFAVFKNRPNLRGDSWSSRTSASARR